MIIKPPIKWMRTHGHNVRVVVLDDGWGEDDNIRLCGKRNFVTHSSNEGAHGQHILRVIGCTNPVTPGIAFKASLYCGKVVTKSHTLDPLVNGLKWALELRAQVLNMSLACGPLPDKAIRLLNELGSMGALIFAPVPHEYDLHGLVTTPSVIPVCELGRSHVAIGASDHSVIDPAVRGPSVSTAILSGVAACAKAYDATIDRTRFLEELRKQAPQGTTDHGLRMAT